MSEPLAASESALPPLRSTWRVRVRGIVIRLGIYSMVFFGAIGLGQRWLIYFPVTAEQLSAASARFDPGQAHDVVTQTPDGLQLHGWHILGRDRICRTPPECEAALSEAPWVVLHFHGNGGHRGHRVSDGRMFATLGADVLLFDYRGYGDNSGSPTETGLLTDARAIWTYATQQHHVLPERIVLYGESLGGAVATRLAADLCRAGTPPAGLILQGTFTSLSEVGGHHYPWLPVSWLLLDRYASIDHIAAVTCPILQFHGTIDTIVPVELGRKLFAQAPDRSSTGVAKQFIEVSYAGHNDFGEAELRQPIARFLETLNRQDARTRQEKDR